MITDAWMGYHGLAGLGSVHQRRSQRAARARGDDRGELLSAVHRVASLARRWLLSTHQGSVEEAHLQSYLDEFVFRFNRRRSRSRVLVFYRLLELAAGHDPVRYRNMVAASGHGRSRRPRQRSAGIHRAWSGRQPSARGGPLTWATPVKWRPPSPLIRACSAMAGRLAPFCYPWWQVKARLARGCGGGRAGSLKVGRAGRSRTADAFLGWKRSHVAVGTPDLQLIAMITVPELWRGALEGHFQGRTILG